MSWYARQPYNNPFSTRSSLTVQGDSTHLTINFERKNRRERKVTVISVSHERRCGSHVRIPTWDLITVYPQRTIAACFPNPPQTWGILDTATQAGIDKNIPAGWPTPSYGTEVLIGNVAARFIAPFGDTRRSLSLVFGKGIHCMIWDCRLAMCDSSQTSPLKEKLELLIVLHASAEQVACLRSSFRPRHLVTIPSCTSKEKYGIVCPEFLPFSFGFRTTRYNTLDFDLRFQIED